MHAARSIKWKSAVAALALAVAGTARVEAALGTVTGVSAEGDTLTLQIGADVLALRVWRTNMVEVDFQPGGAWQPATDVIGATNGVSPSFSLDTNGTPIVIATDALRVEIDRSPCRLRVYDATGTNLLLGEQAAEGVFADGLRLHTATAADYYGINAYYVWDDTSPRILRNTGGFVEAGYQGDGGAPMVWTRNGFGLLVDSDGGQFTISGTNLTFQYVSKPNVLYYIATGDPADILAAFYEVSGRPPMLPKWAMGFANTEWGITQTELTNIVAAYRLKQIPIDHYILDFDWKAWGEDNYGEWRWNTSRFPGGPSGALKASMDEAGIHLSGIMKPRVHVNTVQGGYATTNNLWWPGQSTYSDYFSGLPVKDVNYALPACRAWFADHITNAFATGIQGWWNDEADQAGGGGILFGNWQFLNMQKSLYEGQRAVTSQRVWSINRNFYLGSQRYAYAMWSGDIDGGFAAMARERERMLSSINIGAVKWGMDIGGFNNGGLTTSECYARWMQFGAVVPVYRVHGAENNQRQPWVYGATAEAIAKAAIQLRYRLIPYLYSYERDTYETGIGLVRPLAFQFPEDGSAVNHVTSWMVGDHLLASPVVTEGATSHDVYLPAGTWYDYFRGGAHAGPQTLAYAVNSATWTDLPLFVRAGAILPMQQVVNHLGERPLTNLIVEVFPDWTPSSFDYYDDDGETYAYEGDAWYKQRMAAALEDGRAVFGLSAPEGVYVPPLAHVECRIHAPTGDAVQVDGAPLAPFADFAAFSNSTAAGWASGIDRFGPVTYVRVDGQAARSITISNDWLAPPQFTPAGGTFDGPTLLAAAAPNTSAVIRITSDGTEPTTSSAVYGGPFIVWSSATYRAKAFLDGRSPSATASATLAIDYNQLLNPGFEQQGATTNHPYYWHGGDPDLHGEVFGSAGRVSWRSHGGTWEGTVRGTWAGLGTSGGFWQERPAIPGRTYECSAWFWADNTWSAGKQGMKLEFLTGDTHGTNYLQATTSIISGISQNWTQKFMTATAPAGCEWVRVVVFAENAGANGALQFDDLRLEPQGALPLTIASAHGSPAPPVGTHLYGLGSVLTNAVDAQVSLNGTQYVCAGWVMTGNEPSSGGGNTVEMTLTNAALLTWLWTTNVLDPAMVEFADTTVSVSETDAVATLHVVRGGGTAGVVQVQYHTVDGGAAGNADYTAASGTVQFGDGETNALVMVAILDDLLFESNEDFAVVLHAPAGTTTLGPANVATVTIASDDPDLGNVNLDVSSSYGDPVPGVGLHAYPFGSPVQCFLTNNVDDGLTQYVGVGWTGSGSVPAAGATNHTPPLALTNDSTIAWLWKTNVWFTRAAVGSGQLGGDSSGWYRLGTSVTVQASAMTNHIFTGWTGDVAEADAMLNPLTLSLDQPRSVWAVFQPITGSNLLNNPSFEIQGAAAEAAAYWKLNDPDLHGDASGTALRVNWRATNGAWSAAIRGTWSGTGSRGDLWQEIPITGTNRYRLSAWFWADDGNPYGPWSAGEQYIALDFLSGESTGDTILHSATQHLGAVGQLWKQVSVEADAPAGASWVRVRISATGVGADGSLQVDDLNLHTLVTLSRPALLPANPLHALHFTARWDPVVGATGYRVDVATNPAFAGEQFAGDLFISEYAEGSGTSNRYIEIFNGTGGAADLSQYRVWRINNGGTWPESELSLAGTLAHGTTYVIRTSGSTHSQVVARAHLATASAALAFTGDDAMGLARLNGAYALIDAIGTDGADPGSGWGVSGVADATLDHTLLRKDSVAGPNPAWAVASNEWIVLPVNTFTNIGEHHSTWLHGSDFVPAFRDRAADATNALAVTGLVPGVVYYVRVQATNENGASPYSDALVVTTRSHFVIATGQGAHGTIAPSGAVAVAAGSSTSFLVSAEAFHHIASIATNGIGVAGIAGASDAWIAWSNVWEDGALDAAFAPDLATNATPHWWLHRFFGETNYDDAAMGDDDRDGVPTWQEYGADTDPTNGASQLRLWFDAAGAGAGVQFWSSTGRVYHLDVLTNPLSDDWQPAEDAPGSGGVQTMSPAHDSAEGRYRLRVTLP